MTKINFEETFDIYLFTQKDLDDETQFSKLPEFLSFLKYNYKVNIPYKFSYVSRGGESLIPELTLNENILMDFSPNSLTASREFQFQEFLKEKRNSHLENLYFQLAEPHSLPTNTNAQMKKVATLIKSLIFEGQFIFLEEPEYDLDEECIELFIKALRAQMIKNQQNIFIFTKNVKLWMPYANYHVKREENYKFTTELITKNWQWTKEREIFYNPKKFIADSGPIIKFHIPKIKTSKTIDRKKAA